MVYFGVRDGSDQHAVGPQQRSRHLQPRIHHVQPVGVVAAGGVGVGAQLVAVAVDLAGDLEVVADAVLVVVLVDEILAGVVGRVDVDELDLGGVAPLQELEHLEIVALDHQVARGVPVHALLAARPQCAGRDALRPAASLALAVPSEAVLFVALVHRIAEQLAQRLEVDAAFGDDLREQPSEAGDVLCNQIRGMALRVFGGDSSHPALRAAAQPP